MIKSHTKVPVFLLTVDSLRADHLGCYGYSRPTSPNIDEFATISSLFTQAFSNGPNTPHAFPGIMTGRCSLLSRRLGLYDAPITLAETLRSAGYHTHAFNAGNPYVSAHFAYDRGFTTFEDFVDLGPVTKKNKNAVSNHSPISIPGFDVEHYLVTEANMHAKAQLEEHLITRVLDVVANPAEQPVFLWVHFMEPHYPYLPQAKPQEILNGYVISKEENLVLNQAVRENRSLPNEQLRKVKDLYDASIFQLDHQIGLFLTALRQADLFQDALIILCADHGEEFAEHGDLNHKSKLFDELIQVPLLIKYPNQSAGSLHSQCVSLLQLPSTIMEALSLHHEFPNAAISRHSQLPQLESKSRAFSAASVGPNGGTPVDNDMFALDRLPAVYSLRSNSLKLIFDVKNDRRLLFDLLADAGERVNLYATEKARATHLEEELVKCVCEIEETRILESLARHAPNMQTNARRS